MAYCNRYLICLTIAPCFFSAAIYLNFSRLILLHGPHLARFKPQTYSYIFIAWDIVSLALQAAGGGLADTAADGGSGQTGINLMIAGLSSQVASLAIFAFFCADFAWKVRRYDEAASNAGTRQLLAHVGSSTKSWMALVTCGCSLTIAPGLIILMAAY